MEKWKALGMKYMVKARRLFCKYVFKNPYHAEDLSMGDMINYIMLMIGCIINLFMSLFKFAFGLIYSSSWFISISIYYFVLTGIRAMLLFREWRSTHKKDIQEHRIYDLKSYRFCGVMMFLLNWLLLVMGIPMIYQNPYIEYPKFVMIMFFFYAFYNLVVAIFNMIKFFKINNPILTAAQRVSFVTALVSAYALETTWFSKYGVPEHFIFQQITKIATGSFVGFIIFSIACSMIIQANHELLAIKHGKYIQ